MRYAAIFLLNAGLTIPIVFFSVGLPALMREAGLPLALIGLTALVYLPYALAFLWAPFVDGRRLNGLGLRRSWLFSIPCLTAAVVALGAILGPEKSAAGVLLLALVVTFLGATTRTALFGYATDNIGSDQRPWAAAVLSAGGAVGALIGASGLLFIYGQTNWAATMLIMAAIIALSALTALASPEPEQSAPTAVIAKAPPSLKRFLSRKEGKRVLVFLAPLGLGMGLGFGMLQPQLVDLGFSIEDIGLINGAFICAAMLAGGPVAAFLTSRFGLVAVLTYGLGGVSAVLLYAAAASHLALGPAFGAAAVLLFYLSISFVSIATNTLFMNESADGQKGTDFTIFICANWLLTLVGIALSGIVAGAMGYAVVFLFGALFVLASFTLIGRLPKPMQRRSVPA